MKLIRTIRILSISLCALLALPAAAQTAIDSLGAVNKTLGPWVFSGYRSLSPGTRYTLFPDQGLSREVWRQVADSLAREEKQGAEASADSVGGVPVPSRESLPVAFGSSTPDWLRFAIRRSRRQEDFMYRLMTSNPSYIQDAFWDLPEPPVLPEEDYSFKGYLRRLNLPETKQEKIETDALKDRYNWLHTFNIALQLSQAYVSGNWYQGGASYLAMLGNFLWDVQLNQVYHPKLMFQSTVSYKLSVNSTPDDQYHKYSISQDLFQYNLKMGYKAIHNWYYSFTTIFKTQFFHSYPSNSMVRSASFLSPGELNLGLGMLYSKQNKKKTVVLSISIAPLSYNLKTCIDPLVDHAQFGIPEGRKLKNEFGSNAEINFKWNIRDNITYTTKMYLFTDYHSFQGDWENTFNFQFSRFFSTQLYAHLRYDTLADPKISPKWNKWMLKEILSVGLSYNFSTK